MLPQVVICTAPKSEMNAPELDGANSHVRGCGTVVSFPHAGDTVGSTPFTKFSDPAHTADLDDPGPN